MSKPIEKLILGKNEQGDVGLSLKTLQRHFACFGSSGSGKTVASKVLIEELSRNGIPVIAFDPQGDIASLALLGEEDDVKGAGTDLAIRDSFAENVEVVIWTPGSSKGLPLSINPLQFDGISGLSTEDRVRYFSSTAKNIANLIGYDLSRDDGKSAESILAIIFEHCTKQSIILNDFSDLVVILRDVPDSVNEVVETIASDRFLRRLVKKLNLLTLGVRKLIFQTGVPASIEVLLGLDDFSKKTRVSVIYLNTLHTTEEKEFFIAGISQLLYRWMLRNPPAHGQDGIQCAMFIDEIAPYIPPVKKPACKESLELLYRQARKYGVGCLIATQTPGDIDYKAIGQFSTFTLGTLNTKQEIDKVKGRLESIAPKEIDFIVKRMPALKKGEFLFLSPDEYDQVQTLKVRWLVTKHLVISEEKLSSLIPMDLREYYRKNYLDVDNTGLDQREPSTIGQEKTPVFTSESPEVSEGLKKKKYREEIENNLLVIKNHVFERDLEKKIKPHLKGTIFKREKINNSEFKYLPLIKVALTFVDEKGVFKKIKTEIPENLYLHYKTEDVLFIKNRQIKFQAVVDADPHDIEDLDNHCKLDPVDKSEVDFDFRTLGGKKLDKTDVKNIMERKYRVAVHDSELVLLPIWKCSVTNKDGKESREIVIDGIFGNVIQL